VNLIDGRLEHRLNIRVNILNMYDRAPWLAVAINITLPEVAAAPIRSLKTSIEPHARGKTPVNVPLRMKTGETPEPPTLLWPSPLSPSSVRTPFWDPAGFLSDDLGVGCAIHEHDERIESAHAGGFGKFCQFDLSMEINVLGPRIIQIPIGSLLRAAKWNHRIKPSNPCVEVTNIFADGHALATSGTSVHSLNSSVQPR